MPSIPDSLKKRLIVEYKLVLMLRTLESGGELIVDPKDYHLLPRLKTLIEQRFGHDASLFETTKKKSLEDSSITPVRTPEVIIPLLEKGSNRLIVLHPLNIYHPLRGFTYNEIRVDLI